MREKNIVIISDLQVPYHDKRAVKNLIAFLRDYRPDAVVSVGDDADSPEPSRWARGTALEFAGTLQRGLDKTREIHAAIRGAVGDVPYHISRSNHGDRLRAYVARYAPALLSLRSLDMAELLGYRELEIQYHEKPWTVAPGWVCAHGDEVSLSPIAGRTASRLSEKWGVSVVCGHTHRAGIVPVSTGYNGRTSTRIGMEVGHMMSMRSAGYLRGGHGNWQSAFGLLHVRGSRVHPELVLIQSDGSFCVEGQWYPKASDSSPSPMSAITRSQVRLLRGAS